MSAEFDKKRSALTVSTASIDAYSDELKKNEKMDFTPMSGWMKKKSPALLKGWQKRYFMTIENPQGGWKLVYFDNDKTFTKPNGAFDLNTVSSIVESSKKEFTINFPGRNLELKVKTPELRQQWITCMNNARMSLSSQRTKRQVSLDQVVKMAEESPTKGIESFYFVVQNHKIVDTYTAQQAQVFKEQQRKSLLPDFSKESKKLKEKQSTVQLSNDKIIELIGLKECIKNMNEQFIYNRMIYGYLGKRSKGKVKYFQKRWFILVSAKPLYNEYNDERILLETQLPPWLELDTVTYFKMKDDNKQPEAKGDVRMLDCQEIIIKNMSKSKESGFTFKLNMGDRLYHLMTETELERTKWQAALSNSIRTTKEINNPLKIKIKKNIDPLVSMYDEETQLVARREKMKQKLDQDIQSILTKEDANLGVLMTQLSDLRQDMLESMQACLVKDPPRKDIIKEYTDIYHEKICERVAIFWDQQYKLLESPQLLLLSQWLYDYQNLMKDFFNDDRILLGLKVLLNIYVNRSLESLESVITQIISLERSQEPFTNEQDQLVSQTPVDLFKIINEGFDMAYKLCQCKDTVIKLGGFGKVIIQQYQDGVSEMVDESQLPISKLVSICNNTLALHDNTKSFAKKLQALGNITEEECEKIFDSQKITKNFMHISNNCRERIFIHYFSRVGDQFKKPYLEIKIVETLKVILEPSIETLSHVHDSFSRKIWKQLTDTIVLYYFNQVIISCSKAKKEHYQEFLNKLEADKEILIQELETFIFEKQLLAALKPFDDMTSFLSEQSLQMLEPCKSLRMYFGRAFTEKTVKSILNIRYDMDKDKKKEAVDLCKSLIEDVNKSEPVESQSVRLMEVLGQEEEEQQQQQQQQNNLSRRVDITIDFTNDEDDIQVTKPIQRGNSFEKKEFLDEGYMYKKKPKQKGWDYRYVRIRKGYMYWYINANSREAQNKMNLSNVDEIIPNPKKPANFNLQLEDSKIYKFKTQSKEECELWVKSILREQNQLEIAVPLEAIQIGNGKKPIIQDYDEIARKEKHRQKQEERKRRRIEKENELKRKQQEIKMQQQQQLKELGDKPSPHQVEAFEHSHQPTIKQTTSCWTQFLIALGIERAPK